MSNKADRRCHICGDIALGFNYSGQLSCKSCRIFFFRNATLRRKLVCFEANNCTITKATRKLCSKCRLERCFQIGMQLPVRFAPGSSLFRPLNSISRRITPGSSQPLGPYELQCIQQIRHSLASSFPNESSLPFNSTPQTVENLMRRPPVYMYQLIKYLRRIPIYREQTFELKAKILKAIYDLFLSLKFAFQYDAALDGFIILKDHNAIETVHFKRQFLCQLINDASGFQQNTEIIDQFNQAIEKNETVRDLLISTIIAEKLCKYIGTDYLRYFYALNCYLLKRYTETVYSLTGSHCRYSRLMYLTFNRLSIIACNIHRWIRQLGLHQDDEAFIELAAIKS